MTLTIEGGFARKVSRIEALLQDVLRFQQFGERGGVSMTAAAAAEAEVARLESELRTYVTTLDHADRAILEVYGRVAIALREGGSWRLALQWQRGTCEMASKHAPSSEDTAYDQLYLAECLLIVRPTAQATSEAACPLRRQRPSRQGSRTTVLCWKQSRRCAGTVDERSLVL